MRNAQFISYLEEKHFRQVNACVHRRSIHWRRRVGQALVILSVAVFTWIVIESVQALSIF